MKLIMDMYNLLYKDNCIKNEYFYVSRKSVFLPYLYHTILENLIMKSIQS